MLASTFPPSSLDTYSLSMSSLGCKALCIFMSFLVLTLGLTNVPSILRGRTAQLFISLIRYLLCSLVSSNFHVLLRYSLNIFFLWTPLVSWHPLLIFPSTCMLTFLQAFWFFRDLVVLFLPPFTLFCFSLSALYNFLSQIPSLYHHTLSLSPCGVMVKAMDGGIVEREFKLQSRYYAYFRANTFGKSMKPPYHPSDGLNRVTSVLLEEWLWH